MAVDNNASSTHEGNLYTSYTWFNVVDSTSQEAKIFLRPIVVDRRLHGIFSIGNGSRDDGRSTGASINFWSANLTFWQVVFSEGRVVLEPQLELVFPGHG